MNKAVWILILFIFHGSYGGIWNFHTIAPNLAYRSGQPRPGDLRKAIEKYGIKTLINLRGKNTKAQWWLEERLVCDEMAATHINIRMSAHALPAPDVLLELFDAFVFAEYPILIHCKAGSDRTGAAAVIWRMVMLGDAKDDAKDELSAKYLHFSRFTPEMDWLIKLFEPSREWIVSEYPLLYTQNDSQIKPYQMSFPGIRFD